MADVTIATSARGRRDDEGTVCLLENADANDSDKTFTVPTGEQWEVLWVYVLLATTATAGNRRLGIRIVDASANTIGEVRAGGDQAASLTVNYQADALAIRDTAATGGVMHMPLIPGLVLPAGFGIRVFDISSIDAAADDMTVRILFKRHKFAS
jgi:hypothetical protein